MDGYIIHYLAVIFLSHLTSTHLNAHSVEAVCSGAIPCRENHHLLYSILQFNLHLMVKPFGPGIQEIADSRRAIFGMLDTVVGKSPERRKPLASREKLIAE